MIYVEKKGKKKKETANESWLAFGIS